MVHSACMAVGQRVVDRVDLRIGEQRRVGCRATRAMPCLVGEGLGPRRVARGDRGDGGLGNLLRRAEQGHRGDAGGAEDADAEGRWSWGGS